MHFVIGEGGKKKKKEKMALQKCEITMQEPSNSKEWEGVLKSGK